MLSFVPILMLIAAASAGVAHAVDKRQATCSTVGPTTTDMFDGVTVLPAVPLANQVLGAPTPTGAYNTYKGFGYANIGGLSNVQPPSEPNDIHLVGTAPGTIVPTFKGANTYSLSALRYACVYATQATVAEVPPKCTFQVTCTVYGGGTKSKTFNFVPDTALASSFNYGTFSSDFTHLTSCTVQLKSASLAGVDSTTAAKNAILLLDNVVNQGQKCS